MAGLEDCLSPDFITSLTEEVQRMVLEETVVAYPLFSSSVFIKQNPEMLTIALIYGLAHKGELPIECVDRAGTRDFGEYMQNYIQKEPAAVDFYEFVATLAEFKMDFI